MKKLSEFIWPLIGLAAVIVSGYFLYQELKTTSLSAIWAAILAIPPHRILLAALSTLVAYAALAWYDRIALLHLGVRHISLLFVSLCSFTTYALSHNIGASVFSGALVRYRAYTAKGLTAAQVAVLVALCSFTFFLGTVLLGGFTLVVDPTLLARLEGKLPGFLTDPKTALVVGIGMLAFRRPVRGRLDPAPAPAAHPVVQARISRGPASWVASSWRRRWNCWARRASSTSRCRRR